MTHISLSCICFFWPPPSKANKLLNSTFLREFPELLSSYADSRCDVSFLGDLNFHFDDCSDPQVDRLKNMLSDYGLSQLINVPTHRRGHALDWVVAWSEGRLLPVEKV